MRGLVDFLSSLKPWQLFVLTVGPMALSVFFGPAFSDRPATFDEVRAMFTVSMLVALPGYLVFFSWIFAIGVVCNDSIAPDYRKPTRLLFVAMPIALAYMCVAIFLFPTVLGDAELKPFRALFMTVHVVASFCLYYSLFFAARSLAMLSQPEAPGFLRGLKYFFGLIYFPIGLWFIQPKVLAARAE